MRQLDGAKLGAGCFKFGKHGRDLTLDVWVNTCSKPGLRDPDFQATGITLKVILEGWHRVGKSRRVFAVVTGDH